MTFENNHVENGDDCLTVGSGANGIVFKYIHYALRMSCLDSHSRHVEIASAREAMGCR